MKRIGEKARKILEECRRHFGKSLPPIVVGMCDNDDEVVDRVAMFIGKEFEKLGLQGGKDFLILSFPREWIPVIWNPIWFIRFKWKDYEEKQDRMNDILYYAKQLWEEEE